MVKKFSALAFFLFIFIFSTVICFAQNGEIKVFKLENGQTVVIKEVHDNPIVTIDTWVRTGSINENDENNGVSHFLEHLFFKGTKKYKAGEVDKILESKGATFNASTSKDFTHFYLTISSQHFKEAMNLHSDMLLNAQIPENELTRERKVVQEEIRRAEDNPNAILFKNLNDILFKTHPYKYETLGTEQIIGSIPREKILEYYRKWYVPSNMITVVIGDIDSQNTLALIEKDFQGFNKKNINKIKYKEEPFISKSAETIKKGNYNTGYLLMGFKGVPLKDTKEGYALDIAGIILGEGYSSRLYQEIKEKQKIVTAISSGHFSMKDSSIFYVSANFNPENYQTVKNSIQKELKKLKECGITSDELTKAKTILQRQFLYANESIENIANSIGYSMTIGDKLDYYTKYIEEINKITAQDVQNTVFKYLPESRMAISSLMPEGVAQASKSKALNIIPAAQTSRSFIQKETFKNVTKSVLPNGGTLITEKNSLNDIISMSVIFKGGKLLENTPGMMELISRTLMKGTSSMDASTIALELEKLGIIISPSSNPDYFEIKLKSTIQDFEKAFCILTDIINNPSFNEEDIKQAKGDILDGIKESRDTPLNQAFEKFTTTIYQAHPYGNTGEVIEKNINKITRDDIIKFYKQNFIPANMIISISGKINHDNFAAQISSAFEKKEGNIIKIEELKKKVIPLEKNKLVYQIKDTSSAWMLMGWPVTGISNDKEALSLKIINSLLGDGLSSRLFVNLREKQGLAYAVSSIYPSRVDESIFVLYIGTKPENVKIVKSGFLNEINRIKTEKLSDTELSEIKQKIIGEFLLSQETNEERAHNLGAFEAIGKGYKRNFEFPDLINSISSDEIIQTANRYFKNFYVISIVAPEKTIKDLSVKENKE